jgi:hypothetical protein
MFSSQGNVAVVAVLGRGRPDVDFVVGPHRTLLYSAPLTVGVEAVA